MRADYVQALEDYAACLPQAPGEGNILLADAEARTLRTLFAAEADILSPGFAARLKTFLESHIGLRVFYPEIAKFYRDVQSGHIEVPLPQDAVAGFVAGVRQSTPSVFEPPVSAAVAGSAEPAVTVAPPPAADRPPPDPNRPEPPTDPLKELDPKKARDFTVAGTVNALWKTFLEGEKFAKATAGWVKAGETLQPYVTPILEWLRNFTGS